MTVRRLFSMGGGGFLMDADLRLDRFFYSLTGMTHPRVLLVPTAGGDSRLVIEKFEKSTAALGLPSNVLSLFRGTRPDLEAYVAEHDLVYVSGGNTKNMIALWKLWGLDAILRRAYERGMVMGGVSAGSICWFESGVTDSVPGALTALPGLGWLSGSACPHYDGEAMRRPTFEALVQSGQMPAGIAADDGVAVVYENERETQVVTSRPGTAAWRVEQGETAAKSTRIEARLLLPDGT